MSRLRMVAGKKLDDLLSAAPGAFDADTAMRRLLIEQLTPRLYSLLGVTIAGLLRCERVVEALRGPQTDVEAMVLDTGRCSRSAPTRRSPAGPTSKRGRMSARRSSASAEAA